MATTGGSEGDRVEVAIDATVDALDQVEHIVVLMMENRSFDHMLGYLRLSGRRPELDGLQAGMANVYHDASGKFPQYDGLSFGVHELPVTQLTKAQDPAARWQLGRQPAEEQERRLCPDLHGRARRPDRGASRRCDGLPHRPAPAGVRPSQREVLYLRPLVQLGRRLDAAEPALCDGGSCRRQARQRLAADLPPALVRPPPGRRQGRLLGDVRARPDADPVGGRQRLPLQESDRRARGLVRRPLPTRRTSATPSFSARRPGSYRAFPGSIRASPTCAPG